MTSDRPRCLVVDDQLTNRLKLTRALKRFGYASCVAENGREALALLRKEPFDLLLLDLMMPEMDGYELLALLKVDRDLRDVPVVVISALEGSDAVARAIELGAEDQLARDFDPVLLRARIVACLAKKHARDREREYLRQVERLTAAAATVETNDFDPSVMQLDDLALRDDELGRLARVFVHMTGVVHAREQALRKELRSLQICVDWNRQREQVSSITGTAYFKDLSRKAGRLRARLNDDPSD